MIFPAAGVGRRVGAGMNKAFLKIAGEELFLRSLKKFAICEDIDRLILVVAQGEITLAQNIMQKANIMKPYLVLAGGSERQYSVLNAIKQIEQHEEDIILVHDAARPFVSLSSIQKLIIKVKNTGAAVLAKRAINTIKIADEDLIVKKTLQRKFLWEIETPQGFKYGILKRAYQEAEKNKYLGTDDASLVEKIGIPVHIVEGDDFNFKITTPKDILMAEMLLNSAQTKSLI